MVRKKARKGNTKGKTLSIIMVLAVITFVSSLGFYLASRQAPNSEPKSLKEIVNSIVPSVKKAVVGVEDINLRQKSMDNQRAMDSILMQDFRFTQYLIFTAIERGGRHVHLYNFTAI